MPEQGFHRCADGGEVPKEEHSLLLKASKMLVSLGASVNLTLATGGERYGHFRSGGEGARADPIRRTLAATRSVVVGWPSPRSRTRCPVRGNARVLASPLSPSSNDCFRRSAAVG
jgi:hypothetical protein